MCESEDRPRCWKKETDKSQQSTRRPYFFFKQTPDGTGLRIAVVSQTWLAWPHDLWKFWFRARALAQTETQSLTVWKIDRETECQPDRQFAKEAASVSRSRFLSLSLPIPVVIHQDRSSIPLFSVQTEIMNQQYDGGKRRGDRGRTSRGVKKQKERVISSQGEVMGKWSGR